MNFSQKKFQITWLLCCCIATTVFAQNEFITTWQTTEPNETITIPTTNVEGGYSFSIDWGDGSIQNNPGENPTHTYTNSGTYQIKISGIFPRIYFNNQGDKDKILSIDQWGNAQWVSMEDAFWGCSNLILKATDTPDLTAVTVMRDMFSGATSLVDEQDMIGQWDVSTVKDFTGMFRDAENFNEDISAWVVNAEDVDYMFTNAKSFDQPFGDYWDFSGVTTLNTLFGGAENFNQDISHWNVSNVINFSGMFEGATAFDQDLSAWDISSAKSMNRMFSGATAFSSENYDRLLIGWSTLEQGETRIPSVFSFTEPPTIYCLGASAREILRSAPYNWPITGGASLDCSDAFITTWQVNADESITVPTLGTGYDYFIDWGDTGYELNLSGNATHTYTEAGTYTVRIVGDFPGIYFNNEGSKENILSVEQWGTQLWTSMNNAFYGCTNLVLNATDVPDLSLVSDASNMFRATTHMVDSQNSIAQWNVSSISNFDGMFRDAKAFNEDLSEWDIGNATSMVNMFSGALGFDSLNYDQLLLHWATIGSNETQIPSGIDFAAPQTHYCLGRTYRDLLTTTYGWNITNDLGEECSNAFITKWQTDTDNETITLYTGGADVEYAVDWGDGQIEFVQTALDLTHTYAMAGAYEVKLLGDFTRINFSDREGKDKIQSIEQWGSIQWSSMSNAFQGCSNLILNAADVPDLSNVSSMSFMFHGAISLIDSQDQIGAWDVSQVEIFQGMFNGASSFDEDLGDWDMSSVDRDRSSSMAGMFSGASSFSSLNYDKLLIGWQRTAPSARTFFHINFDGPPTTYCMGASARAEFVSKFWNISDGGESCDASSLSLHVLLHGPYNTENNLMNDNLRSLGLIPLTSPYDNSVTANNSVFDVEGQNAIVDWVQVQIRDKNDFDNILLSTSALLQRDGDVVSVDGSSPLSLDVSSDHYYVSIAHRNHIEIGTQNVIELNNAPISMDFRNNATHAIGEANAFSEVAQGVYAMYPGDVSFSGQIQLTDYSLAANALGFSGYLLHDVNLDGQVQVTDIVNFIIPFIGIGKQF